MDEKQIPACFAEMTAEQMRIDFGYEKFGKPGTERHSFALFWLSVKESKERDAREAKTLDIAREANRCASEANAIARKVERWTMYTAIIAIMAAIIAAMAYIKTS